MTEAAQWEVEAAMQALEREDERERDAQRFYQ